MVRLLRGPSEASDRLKQPDVLLLRIMEFLNESSTIAAELVALILVSAKSRNRFGHRTYVPRLHDKAGLLVANTLANPTTGGDNDRQPMC